MKLAVALAFLGVFLPATSRVNEIVLKSGARGALAVAVIQAPDRFGGPTAGNVIGLTFTVTSERSAKPEVDAASLCYLYGQSTYSRMQSDRAFLEAINNLIDLSAPLVGVRVSIFHSKAESVSVGTHLHFDMRGVAKCRPSL
ncbi:MAG: hypothetical protein LJE62_06000 [Silicimonas sp.]|nr:hypothetical protein [Silicimonas sp.]